MKNFMFVFWAIIFSQVGRASELSVLLGQPDHSLDFIKSLVSEELNLITRLEPEVEYTTQALYLVGKMGVKTVSTVVVTPLNGGSDRGTMFRGFDYSSRRSPVAMTWMGPVENAACRFLSARSGTAFVVPSGNSAVELDPRINPECLGKNILFVASLDQKQGKLTSSTNWGRQVRIATPSVDIPTRGKGGIDRVRSSAGLGMAFVAAKLAVFARQNPDLKGAALIEAFLKSETYYLASLDGKIDGGRALKVNF